MLGFLNQWRQARDELREAANVPANELETRITTSSQLDLGRRLAELSMLNGDELPITPLLVRLYVERAVGLLAQGKDLEELPNSIPEVFFEYLKQVNPESKTAEHFIASSELIRLCCALGRLSLGETLIPGAFTGWEAEQSIPQVAHHPESLTRLVANGVLTSTARGPDQAYLFTSDPVAEFTGAFAWAQYCGQDAAKWRSLAALMASQNGKCDGFRLALALTLNAYSIAMRWGPPPDFPTIPVLAQSSQGPAKGIAAQALNSDAVGAN
jgi:hypothetical protein